MCRSRIETQRQSMPSYGNHMHRLKGLMDRWSSKHNWVRRAAEYDAEEDRL